MGKKIRFDHRLFCARVTVQESGPLVEAPPVGAQADGVRHGPPLATGCKSPAPGNSIEAAAERHAPGTDIDDSFSDDSSTKTTSRGPRGPVIDGVLLSELGTDEVEKPTGKNAAVTASVIFIPDRAADADIERAGMTPAAEEHPVVVMFCCGGGVVLWRRKGCLQSKGQPTMTGGRSSASGQTDWTTEFDW